MKLTRTERWILANQYKILESLYPDEAESYARAREAIEEGFELEYPSLCRDIYEETLDRDGCTEVLDVFQMFSQLRYAYGKLEDKSGIEAHCVQFRGFDGNNESPQLAYARYVFAGGNFTEWQEGDSNSHAPVLPLYRRMVREWKKCANLPEMTKDDIIRITSVTMQ